MGGGRRKSKKKGGGKEEEEEKARRGLLPCPRYESKTCSAYQVEATWLAVEGQSEWNGWEWIMHMMIYLVRLCFHWNFF